jgi:hypothetical protein
VARGDVDHVGEVGHAHRDVARRVGLVAELTRGANTPAPDSAVGATRAAVVVPTRHLHHVVEARHRHRRVGREVCTVAKLTAGAKPQQRTVPLRIRAQWWRYPKAISITPDRPARSTGVIAVVVVPLPSWIDVVAPAPQGAVGLHRAGAQLAARDLGHTHIRAGRRTRPEAGTRAHRAGGRRRRAGVAQRLGHVVDDAVAVVIDAVAGLRRRAPGAALHIVPLTVRGNVTVGDEALRASCHHPPGSLLLRPQQRSVRCRLSTPQVL